MLDASGYVHSLRVRLRPGGASTRARTARLGAPGSSSREKRSVSRTWSALLNRAYLLRRSFRGGVLGAVDSAAAHCSSATSAARKTALGMRPPRLAQTGALSLPLLGEMLGDLGSG